MPSPPPDDVAPEAAGASGAAVRPAEGTSEVAVDGRYLQAPGTGIHQYVVAALRALAEDGIAVTVLQAAGSRPRPDLVAGTAWAAFGSSADTLWELRDLPRFLARRRFALYWAPANTGIPLRRIPGTRTVVTVHDLIPLRMPRRYLAGDLAFALPYLARTAVALARADDVLTVSHTSAADVRRFSGRRATVIASSLAAAPASPDPALVPEALAGRPYLVYSGGASKRKNLDRLLEALALVPASAGDPLLVLLGNGYDAIDPVLERLGITGRVLRTGYVDERTKASLVAGSRGMVYPSLYEGFGLPIVEAFQLGVPVATSDRGSMREVGGEAAIYVDPTSATSIASGIAALLEGDAGAARAAAIERQAARFDPETARAELCAYVRRRLARPRGHLPAGGTDRMR